MWKDPRSRSVILLDFACRCQLPIGVGCFSVSGFGFEVGGCGVFWCFVSRDVIRCHMESSQFSGEVNGRLPVWNLIRWEMVLVLIWFLVEV